MSTPSAVRFLVRGVCAGIFRNYARGWVDSGRGRLRDTDPCPWRVSMRLASGEPGSIVAFSRLPGYPLDTVDAKNFVGRSRLQASAAGLIVRRRWGRARGCDHRSKSGIDCQDLAVARRVQLPQRYDVLRDLLQQTQTAMIDRL